MRGEGGGGGGGWRKGRGDKSPAGARHTTWKQDLPLTNSPTMQPSISTSNDNPLDEVVEQAQSIKIPTCKSHANQMESNEPKAAENAQAHMDFDAIQHPNTDTAHPTETE